MKKLIQWTTVLLATASTATTLLAQRPMGIDVSSYQATINWSRVAGAGIQFSFAKATEGNYYQDAYFVGNEVNGKAAGVLIGAYHFARPDLTSPSTEATYFWNFAHNYILNDGKSLMPALDFETFNGVVGASSYTDWANQWSTNVESSAATAGLSLHPCIYTSACSACNLNNTITPTPWIADWNGESLNTGTPWSTCTGCEEWGPAVWTFWQGSDSGHIRGITGRVDLDTFNGTYTTLLSTETVQ